MLPMFILPNGHEEKDERPPHFVMLYTSIRPACPPARSALMLHIRYKVVRLATLGDAVENAVPLDVVGIVRLDVSSKTVESALDSFLGSRVHHAGLPNLVSNRIA